MNRRSLLVLMGFVFCLFASACNIEPQPNNNNGSQTPTNTPPPPPPTSSPTPIPVNPERLIDIIKGLQGQYVKDSTGTEAGECFTKDDYNQFISDEKPAELSERLRKDKDFLAVVSAIKNMNPEQRTNLLNEALKKYRHPWRELHLNPATASADKLREGQTDEGSRAEKLIAQTVVDLVKQML